MAYHESTFTQHALVRLKQRTKLGLLVLQRILAVGACVNLGSKPGINKNHYLFYSEPDDNCFVAVTDSIDGSVISIWLVEYQNNLGWKVGVEELAQAKEAWFESKELVYAEEKLRPTRAQVKIAYLDTFDVYKVKTLYKLDIADLHRDFFASDSSDAKKHKEALYQVKQLDSSAERLLWLGIDLKGYNRLVSIEFEG